MKLSRTLRTALSTFVSVFAATVESLTMPAAESVLPLLRLPASTPPVAKFAGAMPMKYLPALSEAPLVSCVNR